MKTKTFGVLLAVFCMITFCGCSRFQFEKNDILTTYFADKNGDNTVLGGGVATVRTFSDSMAENPVSLIYAEGKSIAEAEERLQRSADHPLFFGAVRAVVVSEKLAQEGVYEFLKSLEGDYKLRSESLFFVTKDEPKKIVSHKAVNDFSGGFAAESMLENLESDGKIVCVDISDMFEMLCEKKIGIACACIDVEDDIMSFDGYAIFDGEKVICFTNEEETDGINMFLNEDSSLECYENGIKCSVKKRREKKEVFADGERLEFDFDFEFECSVSPENISDEEARLIEEKIEERIEKCINSTLTRAKETGCDFLNLYLIYQKNNRYEFEQADYRKMIKEATTNVDVKVFTQKRNMI